MKKFITYLCSLLCVATAYGQYAVTVDAGGNLQIPTKPEFFNLNRLSIQQSFRLYVNTAPSQVNNNAYISKAMTNGFYFKDASNKWVRTANSSGSDKPNYYVLVPNISWWTDCQIKVIDKYGNLIYFASTVTWDLDYPNHQSVVDNTAVVKAWLSTPQSYNNPCWGSLVDLDTHSSLSEIASAASGSISSIWIYPSIDSTAVREVPIYSAYGVYVSKRVVWGKYLRAIFNDPENTVLSWRKSTSYNECFTDGVKLWRPVRIEYFGTFSLIDNNYIVE